ncbi:hypothetical protein MY5147_008126 [Beauveria neobassiana]
MRLAALTVPRCTFFHVADAIFSVLPLVALLFLCSFLDRTNKGNAKIIGLVNDIHISPSQYRNGLPIYYACYIASRAFEREELFEWSEVLRGIFNVQNWLNSTSYFAIISGLYSFGLSLAVANAGGFVTTIFRLLCYAWDLANVFWYAKTNHDKARGKYNEYTGSGNDRDPKFKLLLLMVIPSDDESSPSAFSFCIKTDKG